MFILSFFYKNQLLSTPFHCTALLFPLHIICFSKLFTCVRASLGGWIKADTLQVAMAALFMFLQRSALFVAPPTVVTLVWFTN